MCSRIKKILYLSLGTFARWNSSINSFFVFSTYFYLSLGRGSIISTPNQLFSTSDLENCTNRPGDNLENLYPTSHGPFLPNFLQITPTASRSLSTKLISTPNFTHYLLLLTAIKNKPEENRTSSNTPTYNFTIYLTICTIYTRKCVSILKHFSLSLSGHGAPKYFARWLQGFSFR